MWWSKPPSPKDIEAFDYDLDVRWLIMTRTTGEILQQSTILSKSDLAYLSLIQHLIQYRNLLSSRGKILSCAPKGDTGAEKCGQVKPASTLK